jgi:hypothetical protein
MGPELLALTVEHFLPSSRAIRRNKLECFVFGNFFSSIELTQGPTLVWHLTLCVELALPTHIRQTEKTCQGKTF